MPNPLVAESPRTETLTGGTVPAMPSPRRHTGTLALLSVAVVLLAALAGPSAAAQELPPYADPVPPAQGYSVDSITEPTPGIEYLRLSRPSPAAEVHALRLQPSIFPRLEIVTAGDHQSRNPARETTSAMCRRVRCVAAVNGDYFANENGFLAGPLVAEGEMRFSEGDITHGVIVMDWTGALSAHTTDELTWDVRLRAEPDIDLAVDRVNRGIVAGQLTLYTSRFGTRTHTPEGTVEITARLGAGENPAAHNVLEPLSISDTGNSPIPDGHVVIAGPPGSAAATVEDLWATLGGVTPLELIVDVGDTRHAIGGSPVLLRNGLYHFPWQDPGSATQGRRPRTFVGWTPAGEMLLVVVEGDLPGRSSGLNLPEAAQLLVRLGAVEGVMLDGGGSSTLVLGSQVRNRLRGSERAVASAIVVRSEWGHNIATAQARGIDRACPPLQVGLSSFTDLGTTNVHAQAVHCAAWWQLAQGVTPLSYVPTGRVTRGQMATFLTRFIEASGGTLPTDVPSLFPDTAGHAHRATIDRLAAAGIVQGFSDGRYRPDAPVTRAQMASFIARTWEYRVGGPLPADYDYFEDDQLDTHERNINAIAQGGFAGGVTAVRYDPSSPVRRDQMATFLARALDALVELGINPPAA